MPVREHEENAVRRSWGVDNTRTALGQNGQGGVRRAGPGRDQGAVRQRTRPRQGSSAPNVGRPAPEGVEDRTLVTRVRANADPSSAEQGGCLRFLSGK